MALCVRADGRSTWATACHVCCPAPVDAAKAPGPGVEPEACCAKCPAKPAAEAPLAVLRSIPDCGGCHDTLSPLPSGLPLGLALPPPDFPAVESLDAARGLLPATRTDTVRLTGALPAAVPLRC